MSDKKTATGWWTPNGRRWHYIVEQRSLCGNWAWPGPSYGDLEGGPDDHPENCKACQRKKAKLDAKQPHPKGVSK